MLLIFIDLFFSVLFLSWQIEVVNPDGSPATGVLVKINPGEVQGITSANGMARLSINTEGNPKPMTVTVSVKSCLKLYLFLNFLYRIIYNIRHKV